MKVPFSEQETNINYAPAQTGITCQVYSCMPAVVNKLKRYSLSHPGEVTIIKDDEYGVIAEVPNSWIKISPKRRVNMSDEQKRVLAERLRQTKQR